MRLLPLSGGGLTLRLDYDEAQLLERLIDQLLGLLQSHSGTLLDPDPLFANLEVGGSDSLPVDPALARLFPDAFEEDELASDFRRVTEQGLINRKLHDAIEVSGALGLDALGEPGEDTRVEAVISRESLPAWARTLTALRLAIAARIGLEREEDHARLIAEEETRSTVLVYDWLGAILDSVLRLVAE